MCEPNFMGIQLKFTQLSLKNNTFEPHCGARGMSEKVTKIHPLRNMNFQNRTLD